MDNLTHSLVAGLIGAWASRRHPHAAAPIMGASLLSSNIPDADFLYAHFLSGPFGYMLHHRGHTHTIVGAAVCALLSWAALLGLLKLLRRPVSRELSSSLAVVSVIGCMAHLVLDWLNTYGVHPYWPVSNKWIFGDSLFIIEPLLWISLSLALMPLLSKRWAKTLTALPLIAGLGLIFFSGKVPPAVSAVFCAILFLVAWASRRKPASVGSNAWLAISVAVVLTFIVTGAKARSILAGRATPDEALLVSFTGPSPANPLCWTYIQLVQTENHYVYRRGSIEPFGRVFSINCSAYALARHRASSHNDEVLRIPKQALRSLGENCRWNAFRIFSRVPLVVDCDDGMCASDLRFSSPGRRNFSTVPLEGDCPGQLPPWDPPVNFGKS